MSFVLVRTDTLEALPIGTDAVFVGSADWKVDLCLAGDWVDDVHCELAGDHMEFAWNPSHLTVCR